MIGNPVRRGFRINSSLMALALVYLYLLVQSGCANQPVSSVDFASESEITTSVFQTLESNETAQAEKATPTPKGYMTVEEIKTLEASNYISTDFSLTSETLSKIDNGHIKEEILRISKAGGDIEKYPFIYGIILDDGESFGMAFSQAYFRDFGGEGKSVLKHMLSLDNNISIINLLNLKEDSLEYEVLTTALESQTFVDDKYLDGETRGIVHSTILYVSQEGDKYICYSFNDGGMATYIQDGEVWVFKGKEIPNIFPEEVRDLYEQGYSRVDLNNGVLEGSGKLE